MLTTCVFNVIITLFFSSFESIFFSLNKLNPMRFILSVFVVLFLKLACAQNKVLIIGLDGCRADALVKAHTPNLDSLRQSGIYCSSSWQLGKTKSGPGWSSMLTGVWDAKHNVSNNLFSNHNFEKFPFFTSYVKRLDPSKKSVLVVGWKSLYKISKKNGWDECLNGKNDNDCLSKTIHLLKNEAFDVNMIHLNDIDFAGHTTGFELDNKKYIKAIEEADRKIGKLINVIKNRPNFINENWLILSSTDHGGKGKHHSGNSVEERKVWWIASSKETQKIEIIANDPGSYFYENMPTDSSIIAFYPSIVDIATTAVNHLFPNISNKDFQDWGLDGKSWLDFKINDSKILFFKNELILDKKEKLFYNNSCTVKVKFNELINE
jgi:predicted AlkP superfamily pyrophosphatase or phosphodiesterase